MSRRVHRDLGSVNMFGNIDAGSHRIKNVATPVDESDAATKVYVDARCSTGDIKWSIRSSDHERWLLCDGRSLMRSDYSSLFALIGTTFGSNSVSTFTLPDCQGRVLGAASNVRPVGQTAGQESHTLTVNEMPSHTHTGTTSSAGSHSHVYYTGKDDGNLSNSPGQYPPGDGVSNVNELNTSTTGAHSHTFTTDARGSGQAFNIMQPTLFIGQVFIFSE